MAIDSLAIFHLEKIFREPFPKEERRRLFGAETAADVMNIMYASPLDRYTRDVEKVSEVYIALLGKGKYILGDSNQKGWDTCGIVDNGRETKVARIQVKTERQTDSNHQYTPKILSSDGSANYDVWAFLGFGKSRNPVDADLILVPREAFLPYIERGVDKVTISYSRFNQQRGNLNSFWGYYLANHSRLDEMVTQYVQCSTGVIVGSLERQLELF